MPRQVHNTPGLSGKFIVFDGPDGCGKTTVRDRVAEELRAAGYMVTTCKDPGGTAAGERIRGVILDHDLAAMSVRCETLLFMASRAQLVYEVIQPALRAGHVVLCDRFVSATCAYQVAAGESVGAILDLARYATGDTWPDLTFVLDVPVETGFARIGRRNTVRREAQPEASNRDQPRLEPLPAAGAGRPADLDSMERRPVAFHEAVRANFLDLSAAYPAPVEIVDATQPLEAILEHVLARLMQFP